MLEIATRLGQERFDVMGWSFGGFVGMQLAELAPERVRRVVLIDVAGRPDPASLGPIAAGLERLGSVYREPAEYIERTLSSGAMSGCLEEWREYLQEDVVPTEGGLPLAILRTVRLPRAPGQRSPAPSNATNACWPTV